MNSYRLSLYDIFLIFLIVGFTVFSIVYEDIVGLQITVAILGVFSSTLFILTTIKLKEIRLPTKFTIFYVSLLVWMVISSFYSKNVGESIVEVVKMFAFLVIFAVTYTFIKINPKVQNLFLIIFAVTTSVLVLKDLPSFILKELKGGLHFGGSFFWHNQTAGFLLFVIPILLSLFFIARNIFVKSILLVLTILCIISMIVTYSRGGWLSLLGSLFLFAALNIKKIKINLKLIFIIAIIGCILAFSSIFINPHIGMQRLQTIVAELSPQTRTVSGNLRLQAAQNSLKMIKSFPLFGVGPGAFGASYYAFQTSPWLYSRYAHNHFLHTAAEVGLPGFFLFAGLFITVFITIIKKRKKLVGPKTNPLILGLLAALFGSFLHSFIDFDWSIISLYSIFWILLAILLAYLNREESRHAEFISASRGILNPLKQVQGQDDRVRNDTKFVTPLVYLLLLPIFVVSLIILISERNYKFSQKYFSEDDFSKSEASVIKAIALNPFDERFHFALGLIKQQQRKLQPAKDEFKKAIALSPYSSDAYYNIGLIEYDKKNYKETMKWFSKAVETNPFSHPKLYDALSDTNLKLGNTKKARETLKIAVERAFPLNESFRGFEYLYDYTGFKKDLAETYIRLITLDIMLNEKKEAKKLLPVVEKDLDPKNITLPIFKKIL